ncbi:MAG: nickel pincer cofactor biosynthesis protein LarC [Sporolactobacillus sp.]
MTKTLYLDCFSGISGDMLLGALIDVGADADEVIARLKLLPVDGYRIHVSKRYPCGIAATDVTVELDHAEPVHGADSSDHHHHGTSRNLADCTAIIAASSLPAHVKAQAIHTFETVARAEAHVHGLPIDRVHFHEIGAVDSIVDIVGTFIALDLLGVERVCASALHDGSGFIDCAHGRLPVPVPAVAQMLADAVSPILYVQDDVATELVTPTGMAIVKTVAEAFGPPPALAVTAIGYGCGKREIGRLNALRAFLGESDKHEGGDSVCLLETNIDDQSGEMLGYAMHRLLDAGALDCYFTPIYMKKNRPAVKLSVICRPPDGTRMTAILLEETSTLGVRRVDCARTTMSREQRSVNTCYGSVGIKLATYADIKKYAPEFDDCARLARQQNIPLRVVYEAALAAARKQTVRTSAAKAD